MEIFKEINKTETKEKPAVLYIAAQTPGIKELMPMEGNYRDEKEGPVIF